MATTTSARRRRAPSAHSPETSADLSTEVAAPAARSRARSGTSKPAAPEASAPEASTPAAATPKASIPKAATRKSTSAGTRRTPAATPPAVEPAPVAVAEPVAEAEPVPSSVAQPAAETSGPAPTGAQPGKRSKTSPNAGTKSGARPGVKSGAKAGAKAGPKGSGALPGEPEPELATLPVDDAAPVAASGMAADDTAGAAAGAPPKARGSRGARRTGAETAGGAEPPASRMPVPAPTKKKASRSSVSRGGGQGPAVAASPKPVRAEEPGVEEPGAAAPAVETEPRASTSPRPPAPTKTRGRQRRAAAGSADAGTADAADPGAEATARTGSGAARRASPAAKATPGSGTAASAHGTPAAAVPEAPAPAPTPSVLSLAEGDGLLGLRFTAGIGCPPALADATAPQADAQGLLQFDPIHDLVHWQRLAREAGHRLHIDAPVWQHLATQRDMAHRVHALQAAYPGGPFDAALAGIVDPPLLPHQAEGALFAVVAGRALLADEVGLDARQQAIAAARLWQRHFGLQRVLVLCVPEERHGWRRAWARAAGAATGGDAADDAAVVRVIDGGLHQRSALWSGDAGVRIVSPEVLETDAAHLDHWAPQLLVVDQPQQLPGWTAIAVPQVIALCQALVPQGETMQPAQQALLEGLVEALDAHRLGALAAVRRIAAVREGMGTLADDEIDRLDDALSRVMLQRLREEVQGPPPTELRERLVALQPAQREAHDRLRGRLQRLLAGWRRSGHLADADQWQLGQGLRALASACHRTVADDPASAWSEPTRVAAQAQLDAWAAAGLSRVAIVGEAPAPVAGRSALRWAGELAWVPAGVPVDAQAVLHLGVPWRLPRNTEASPPPAVQVALVAQDSLEEALFDTLPRRARVPRGTLDAEQPGYLAGQRLADWIAAVDAVVPRG